MVLKRLFFIMFFTLLFFGNGVIFCNASSERLIDVLDQTADISETKKELVHMYDTYIWTESEELKEEFGTVIEEIKETPENVLMFPFYFVSKDDIGNREKADAGFKQDTVKNYFLESLSGDRYIVVLGYGMAHGPELIVTAVDDLNVGKDVNPLFDISTEQYNDEGKSLEIKSAYLYVFSVFTMIDNYAVYCETESCPYVAWTYKERTETGSLGFWTEEQFKENVEKIMLCTLDEAYRQPSNLQCVQKDFVSAENAKQNNHHN